MHRITRLCLVLAHTVAASVVETLTEPDIPILLPVTPEVEPVVPEPKRWRVKMGPKFLIGAIHVRGKDRPDPPSGHKVLCPNTHKFCIDERYSDKGTCMYPSPVDIKQCLDDSCSDQPDNEANFQKVKEDSYCKDFKRAASRVCQWLDNPCTCDKFDIEYVDAVYWPRDERTPEGYKVATTCAYLEKYKRVNKRELKEEEEEAEAEAPKVGPKLKQDADVTTTKGTSNEWGYSLIAATLLMVTLA
jgi:hypothetical protein